MSTHTVRAGDGVSLHVESTGRGAPLLFIHEFAGDHRSWEPQVRYFSAGFRCIRYAARGYPPSGVPTDAAAYSQQRAVADAVAVLDGLGIPAAHLVGLSMGGFTTLHLVLRHPDRVLSAVAAGAGYGSPPDRQAAFRAESEAIAAAFEADGAAAVAQWYAAGPARVQFQNKNPRGWAEFAAALAAHSSLGSALTMRGVQAARPSLYELTAAAFAAEGAAKVAERYAVGPARVQFQNKNPRGWAEFAAALAGHSDLGSALTMRGVQAARPSLYALTDELAKVRIPVLVLVGDEDDGCLEPALMLKRTIPTSGLAVLPRTGHTANLEDPDVFNRAVDRFLGAVARGAWHPRDPRSVSDSTMGLR